MLVLARKAGEKLLIGDDIEIVVLNNSGNRTKIGVVAPSHIKVIRGELEAHAPEPAPASPPAEHSDTTRPAE